jgi:hypothetical protein
LGILVRSGSYPVVICFRYDCDRTLDPIDEAVALI